jgi:AcrR family transcriptional regulator
MTAVEPEAKRTAAGAKKGARELLEAAQAIVRETGNFDLPMRTLAARAQVSLRTPYEVFGSKNGIIRALLKSEQEEFREIVRNYRSADRIEMFFDRTLLGMDFYAREQPFYRALFRATQAFSGGDETEPAREMLPVYVNMVRRATEEKFLVDSVDATNVAEILTDIFAANLRTWASSDFDIWLAGQRICFGFSLVLGGAAAPQWVERLQKTAHKYDAAIRHYTRADRQPSGDAAALPEV